VAFITFLEKFPLTIPSYWEKRTILLKIRIQQHLQFSSMKWVDR